MAQATSDKGDKMARRKAEGPDRVLEPVEETRLDDHVDAPSTVRPGDAPHDTTDPTERATSVPGDVAAAARAGHGTVNAVIPLREPDPPAEPEHEDRIERYESLGAGGRWYMVERNMETGESRVLGYAEDHRA